MKLQITYSLVSARLTVVALAGMVVALTGMVVALAGVAAVTALALFRAGSTLLVIEGAVLPHVLLLRTSPGLTPTKILVSISIAAIAVDLGKRFFLLDLLLSLLIDLALVTFSIISVVGVEESSGTQWDVLAASAVSNL